VEEEQEYQFGRDVLVSLFSCLCTTSDAHLNVVLILFLTRYIEMLVGFLNSFGKFKYEKL
jgi:hypothetical protein